MKDIINTKEYQISKKEEEINRIKKLIEMETSEKEIEIRKMRVDIEEQKKLIGN